MPCKHCMHAFPFLPMKFVQSSAYLLVSCGMCSVLAQLKVEMAMERESCP